MKVHTIKKAVTSQEMNEMLEALGDYIKAAVDIKRGVLAGGGILHADCERILLDDGSRQEDIWGADWLPATREVRFEALINIRPRQNNRSMVIQDREIRSSVEKIIRKLFLVNDEKS